MTNPTERNVAIILAGGTGVRMNSEKPKQLLEIAGKPVIIHTLLQFDRSDLISDIVVVCDKDHLNDIDEVIKEHEIGKIHKIVRGGMTRQGSSFEGIKNCPEGTGFVLIHDAVRPFVSQKMIKDTLEAAMETGAAGTVIDSPDTLVVKKDEFIIDIINRNDVKRIQTPQGFGYETIFNAHEEALKKGIGDSTDDCGIVLAMGGSVKAVEGSVSNIKITYKSDLLLAEKLILKSTAG